MAVIVTFVRVTCQKRIGREFAQKFSTAVGNAGDAGMDDCRACEFGRKV
ncbi:hypothetical protein [Kitasatospora sp. NPDC004531]